MAEVVLSAVLNALVVLNKVCWTLAGLCVLAAVILTVLWHIQELLAQWTRKAS